MPEGVKNDWFYVSTAADSSEQFQERRGVEIEGYKTARSREKRLEYDNKPGIPRVGMTLLTAYDTKLGAPTRTTREKSTYAGADHFCGHLYWGLGGRQNFPHIMGIM